MPFCPRYISYAQSFAASLHFHFFAVAIFMRASPYLEHAPYARLAAAMSSRRATPPPPTPFFFALRYSYLRRRRRSRARCASRLPRCRYLIASYAYVCCQLTPALP